MPLLGRIAQELDLVQECQVPMPALCAVLGWSCPKSGGPGRTAVGSCQLLTLLADEEKFSLEG